MHTGFSPGVYSMACSLDKYYVRNKQMVSIFGWVFVRCTCVIHFNVSYEKYPCKYS